MSKQSDAKASQGYQDKPVPPTCGNCRGLKSDRILPEWMERENQHGRSFGRVALWSVDASGVEKNLRCGLGNFAVKKSATCNLFLSKIDVG